MKHIHNLWQYTIIVFLLHLKKKRMEMSLFLGLTLSDSLLIDIKTTTESI